MFFSFSDSATLKTILSFSLMFCFYEYLQSDEKKKEISDVRSFSLSKKIKKALHSVSLLRFASLPFLSLPFPFFLTSFLPSHLPIILSSFLSSLLLHPLLRKEGSHPSCLASCLPYYPPLYFTPFLTSILLISFLAFNQ